MNFDDQSKEMFRIIRLPENYWSAKVSEIGDHPHKKVIFDWSTNIHTKMSQPRGLLLNGPYGRGKSSCAAILLKVAVAHGYFGLWMNCREMRGAGSFNKMYDENTSLFERARNVPILVMDELVINEKLAGGRTPYEVSIFEDLVRYRVARKRITIVTTNHDMRTIEKHSLGLYNILMEAVEHVPVSGPNYREQR